MELQERKYYYNRKREVRGPLVFTNLNHPYVFTDDHGRSYCSDGVYHRGHTSERDLIEEFTDGFLPGMGVQIEAGKYYYNRNGYVIGPMILNEYPGDEYFFRSQDHDLYTAQGSYYKDRHDEMDLIEEFIPAIWLEEGRIYCNAKGDLIGPMINLKTDPDQAIVYPFESPDGTTYTEYGWQYNFKHGTEGKLVRLASNDEIQRFYRPYTKQEADLQLTGAIIKHRRYGLYLYVDTHEDLDLRVIFEQFEHRNGMMCGELDVVD